MVLLWCNRDRRCLSATELRAPPWVISNKAYSHHFNENPCDNCVFFFCQIRKFNHQSLNSTQTIANLQGNCRPCHSVKTHWKPWWQLLCLKSSRQQFHCTRTSVSETKHHKMRDVLWASLANLANSSQRKTGHFKDFTALFDETTVFMLKKRLLYESVWTRRGQLTDDNETTAGSHSGWRKIPEEWRNIPLSELKQ